MRQPFFILKWFLTGDYFLSISLELVGKLIIKLTDNVTGLVLIKQIRYLSSKYEKRILF